MSNPCGNCGCDIRVCKDCDIYNGKYYTNDEVITMLKEIREVAWKRHSKYDDDIDFEVDKTVDIVVGYIDEKINDLKGETDGKN